MKIKLVDLQYLFPFDVEVELLTDDCVIGPKKFSEFGYLGYEVISIYPSKKNSLVIRCKEIEK